MRSNWKYTLVFRAKIPTLNLKLDPQKMSVSLHMCAILEKPSNLPNKINSEQKQHVPDNLLWASSLDTGQKSCDIYFYKHNRRLMLANCCTLVQSVYVVFFFL